MMVTVIEAYKQFKIEHKSVKVGKSKFASLRPIHIQPVSEKDQNVCWCSYHENVEMMLDSLRKICPKPGCCSRRSRLLLGYQVLSW